MPLWARASQAPVPITSVGRHRLEGLIGRGGVGTVYRAYDTARACLVAFKRLELGDKLTGAVTVSGSASVPSGSVTSEDARKHARRRAQLTTLFQREYHTLAQLAHPRIIEVFDYGIDDHGPYYTMELLEGKDLSQSGPMPWRRACEILRDVASALTLLHSRRLLHRDISPRNVHCTAAGVAKLIDFGAMSPMGPCEVMVGTPSFVAPEVVQSQSLDARTDLYSLGALGYYLLTGRVAYPARSFSDVRDAFRSHPPVPSSAAPEIPAALDNLIMQLLSMDRGARPGSAVELVERLTAIGGLEHDPRLAVANAYLSTPTLVGRHKELLAVRRRALRALRGHGASLLVTGPSGVGRSRLLDACALEGKLAGAYVLRGAPGAAGGVEHGVVRALLLQLHALLSDAERRVFDLPSDLRDQLTPGLIWTRALSKPTSLRPEPIARDPSEIPRGVQEYFERLATQRSLMILIDDFQAIDEPSAAVFAGLAPLAARGRLVIVAAVTNDAPVIAKAALRLLRSYSRALPLEPLQAHETESMLGSVFGTVPNLRQVAHRLHALSEGKPRSCMELAQHLVDTGIIRYETGGFVLPESLASSDVPASLEDAFRARFTRLPREAQTLGCVVALCAGTPLTIDECLRMSGLAGTTEGERGLSELLASQMVVIEDEHIMLRQGTLASALFIGHDANELRTLRLRVAATFAKVAELRVRGAELYFSAGDAAAGLDTLLVPAESGRLTYETLPTLHDVIAEGRKACEALDRPRFQCFLLRRAQLHHRFHFTEPCDKEELLSFADELSRMSGLAQWHELGGEGLDAGTRLARALELASSTYERATEHDRVYGPQDAIPELSRYLAALVGHGASTFDLDLQERAPSLGDFVLLAPGIQVAEWIVCAMRDLRASRHAASLAGMRRVLARLDEPDHAGLPPNVRTGARLGVLYTVALTNAALGDPIALEQAEELQELPSMRISAWRVRQIAHLHRGDAQQAEECRRQLELLLIQHGPAQAHHGTTLETEMMCYACSDDLLSLRRVLPEVEAMAAKHEGWQPVLWIARGELERIRGRLNEALACYERALEQARPGRHMMWPYVAGFHMRTLVELGQPARAKELALAALPILEQGEMGVLSGHIICALAQAEGELGELDRAIERIDEQITLLEERQVSGLFAALTYELRAKLALMARDSEGLSRAIERGREHYGVSADSPFTARVARLFAAARTAGLVSEASAALAERNVVSGAVARLRRELAQCSEVEERAERAVVLLVEMTGALHGHLYGLQNGQLAHLGSSHDRPRPELLHEVGAFITHANQSQNDATELVDSSFDLEPSHTTITSAGVEYCPFPIQADDESTMVVAAVVLAFAPDTRRTPPPRLLVAIGEELTSRGDLTRLTLIR
jgi:tetratricopeptide (TPR) repeat protein